MLQIALYTPYINFCLLRLQELNMYLINLFFFVFKHCFICIIVWWSQLFTEKKTLFSTCHASRILQNILDACVFNHCFMHYSMAVTLIHYKNTVLNFSHK